jgi:hypothetical protein
MPKVEERRGTIPPLPLNLIQRIFNHKVEEVKEVEEIFIQITQNLNRLSPLNLMPDTIFPFPSFPSFFPFLRFTSSTANLRFDST